MGASCLTDIIPCQIQKENPNQTLSDFFLRFCCRAPVTSRRLDMGVESAYTTEFLDGAEKQVGDGTIVNKTRAGKRA